MSCPQRHVPERVYMPKAPALEVHDEVFEDWKTTKKDQVKWVREVKDLHWVSDIA